jgi:hypothetical protein
VLQVVEAEAPGQSLSALRRHLVLNQADDASDYRTGNATSDRLAGESTDVDIVARPGHHGNERTKELTTTDTSDCASIVLPSVPKLMSFDAAPAALPPTAPAIS